MYHPRNFLNRCHRFVIIRVIKRLVVVEYARQRVISRETRMMNRVEEIRQHRVIFYRARQIFRIMEIIFLQATMEIISQQEEHTLDQAYHFKVVILVHMEVAMDQQQEVEEQVTRNQVVHDQRTDMERLTVSLIMGHLFHKEILVHEVRLDLTIILKITNGIEVMRILRKEDHLHQVETTDPQRQTEEYRRMVTMELELLDQIIPELELTGQPMADLAEEMGINLEQQHMGSVQLQLGMVPHLALDQRHLELVTVGQVQQ